MAKKIILLLPVLLSTVFLTGCWDYIDIEDKSILTGVGVDYSSGKYKITVNSAELKVIGKQAEESKRVEGIVTFSGEGINLDEARAELDNSISNKLFLGAVQATVFGPGFAEQGIEEYANRVNTIYDYRKTVLFVISREPAEEIMKLKPKNDITIGFMIDEIMHQLTDSGMSVYTPLGDVLSNIALKHAGYVLPYIGKEEDSVKYLGLAVMDKESKFQGFLNHDESRGVVYCSNKAPDNTCNSTA